MVAPHDTGDLVRSLVRVPGSGTDRTAGSECLDLARASSLAASVPVPQTLPPALATPKVNRPSPQLKSLNEKLGSEDGVAAGILDAKASSNPSNRKRPCPQESSASDASNPTSTLVRVDPAATKRARIVYMTKEQILSQAGRVVPVNTPSGPILVLQAQSASSSTSGQSLNSATLTQLIQERDNLRDENLRLQQRLNLFQQLFRDKKRLGSVVKRLGVELP